MDGSPGPFRRWFLSGLAAASLVVGASTAAAQVADREPAAQGGVARQRAVSASGRAGRHAVAAPRHVAQSSHRPVSYGMLGPAVHARSYVPRHEKVTGVRVVSGPATEILPEGTVIEAVEGNVVLGGGSVCSDGCAECGEPCHAGCGCATCYCLVPCPVLSLENLEVSIGVQGFTGPANRGETGSFGFYEGVNWGTPVWNGALGFQAGFRAVQTNFEGASFTADQRNQGFLTGGFFRRVDWGLQGGVVVDYLRDDWYYTADLVQIRGEVSWVFPCRHEFGFWFTSGTQNDDVRSRIDSIQAEVATLDELLKVTDLYAFYYRHRFDDCNGVEGRLFAGFTGRSDGLIGAELRSALSSNLSLEAEFTYLIPDTPANSRDHVEEAWNVAVGLVWRPGCRRAGAGDYYRPLFAVASNGTFLFDRE